MGSKGHLDSGWVVPIVPRLVVRQSVNAGTIDPNELYREEVCWQRDKYRNPAVLRRRHSAGTVCIIQS